MSGSGWEDLSDVWECPGVIGRHSLIFGSIWEWS